MRSHLAGIALGSWMGLASVGLGPISPALAQSARPRASAPRPRAAPPRPSGPALSAAGAGGSRAVAPAPAPHNGSSTGAAAAAPAVVPGSSPASPPPRPGPAPAAVPPPSFALAPPRLPTFRDLPPPPGYVLESHRNWGLAAAGGIIFLGGYIAGIAVSGGDPRGGAGTMAIPLIGPWMTLGSRHFQCQLDLTLESAMRCQTESLQESSLVGSYAAVGVVQLLGASLLAIGIFDRSESWVRADLMPGTSALTVEPVVSATRAGLNVAVSF